MGHQGCFVEVALKWLVEIPEMGQQCFLYLVYAVNSLNIVSIFRQDDANRLELLRDGHVRVVVAQSMAFEGEPVPVARIRATLARITPPALLKPRKAS